MSQRDWMDDFLDALDRRKIKVQPWFCPIEHDWSDQPPGYQTVEWRGDVAYCMYPTCPQTSVPPR